MRTVLRGMLLGAGAGAAGTTALNGVTYLDMVTRGRPASSAPEKTVETLSEKTGVEIPGNEETRQNRVAGLGPLTGMAAGVGVGAVLGALRAVGVRPRPLVGTTLASLGALIGGNGPMTAMGVTDPRSWSANAWLTDIIPHVAYGAVTATLLDRLDPNTAGLQG